MYHSITFGEKNTWDDWYLIPSSRPSIVPPSVKTKTVEIPGVHGVADISEALTGYPVFGNRSGSLQFIVDHEKWNAWHITYATIANYLGGRRMKMILEDDPGYYYEGRFTMGGWQTGQNFSAVTINYDVYPFKREIHSTLEDWLWDPFNFHFGVINDNLSSVQVYNVRDVTIYVSDISTERVTPIITAGADNMSVMYNNKIIQLTKDEPVKSRHIVLTTGANKLTFFGMGTVSIEYRGGMI